MSVRKEVLGLYRRIFRLTRTWQSASGNTNDTTAEKQYIKDEAKRLFRKNQNVREHLSDNCTKLIFRLSATW
jgi:heme oxygenase